jgi:hypothetical protein
VKEIGLMNDHATHSAAAPRSTTTPAVRVLAAVMAALLAVDGYVHLNNASSTTVPSPR